MPLRPYMAACFAASISFVLLFGGCTIIAVWSRVSGHIIWTDVAVMPFYLLFVFPSASVLGLAPSIFAYRIGRRFVPHSCTFRVLAGAFVGALVGVLVTELVRVGLGSEDDEGNVIPFIVACGRLASMAVPSGALGGWVFWLLNRRDESGA